MGINNIKIQNFRSFNNDEVNIVFPNIDQPISIVGYNNSGKTNIISALLLGCSFKDSWVKYTIDDFYCKKTENPISIKVAFDSPVPIPLIYGKNKDKKCYSTNLTIKYDNDTAQGYCYAVDDKGEVIRRQEQIKGAGLPVLFGKYKDKLNLYYIDFQNLEKHLKISKYSLLGKALEEVKSDFKLDTNLIKDKSDNEISRISYFQKLLDFLESKLLKTKKFEDLLNRIESTIKKQLMLDEDSIRIDFNLPDSDEIYDSMKFKLSDNPKKPPIPLDLLGDGFRALLIIAILRSLLNTEEGGKIIILEEPETYLHEHFQDYFYKILCDLAKNNQVIYTTHSKKFVDIFNPESIIKVSNENYIASKIVLDESFDVEYKIEEDDFSISNPEDFRKYILSLEPNIGNIIFADKVIVTEGPDDIQAYKMALSEFNLPLNNIAIVCAIGKDPIITLVQLCKRFEIAFFVIHDWDLDDSVDPHSKPVPDKDDEKKKLSAEKAQWTKNNKILSNIGDEKYRHINKKNLETVLGISSKSKGSTIIFNKLNGKNIKEIKKEFPGFISDQLLEFLNKNSS